MRIPLYLVIVAVCWCFLTDNAERAFSQDKLPTTSPDAPPLPASRRISTCHYLVGFARNEDSLSETARSVISDAVAQASRNGSHEIRVGATACSKPDLELAAHRFDAVKEEIAARKKPEDDVSGGTGRLCDTGSNEPIDINVCPVSNNTPTQTKPVDGEHLVDFQIGPSASPSHYANLGPRFWTDVPLEVVKGPPPLSISWPDLGDATSETVTRCLSEKICNNVIEVSLTRASSVGQFGRWATMECCTTDGTSLLLKLPRIADASLFVDKYTPIRNRLYMKGKGSDGQVVYGSCWLEGPPPPAEAWSSRRRLYALISETHHCYLTDFGIGNGLTASVAFDGAHFGQWKQIHAAILTLLNEFARPLSDR